MKPSGKSTLARVLLGLTAPDPGSLWSSTAPRCPHARNDRTRAQKQAMQLVFQNPDAALNRALTVRTLLSRAVMRLARLSGDARTNRLHVLLNAVRLPEPYLAMRARQLSGGIKQRVAIARAFVGEPRVVVCDEPTTALDVSVQAAILNLLADLQAASKVAYVLISHDLSVVRYLSDRIAVLYQGRLLEIGPAADLFDGPCHPYTEILLASASALDRSGPPRAGPDRTNAAPTSDMPDDAQALAGCVFQARCPRKLGALCERDEPSLSDAGAGHAIRCHVPAHELRCL